MLGFEPRSGRPHSSSAASRMPCRSDAQCRVLAPVTAGQEPEGGCGGGAGSPTAGRVRGPRSPAGPGVTGGSGRKTEDPPRGHCAPDPPRGALRSRAGNSCWLPGFRAVVRTSLGSRCSQRGFQRAAPELNAFPLLTAADLGSREEGSIMRPRAHPRFSEGGTPLAWLLLPHYSLASVQLLPG